MKKSLTSRSGFFKPGVVFSCAFCAFAVVLAFAFYATAQAQTPKENSPARLTAAEAKKMAEGLKPLLNDSSEGLVSVQRADGTAYTDLQGRFQNVTVATKDANGKVTAGCVNNTDAAAGFFGIDRKLLGLAPKAQPAQPADR